ncbi:putative lipid II flippase FtsW [Thermodesulfovibrionales bacterium]|nr:putative lipid II flippase FtsW [Thermodesulfovibrionales bacterium]
MILKSDKWILLIVFLLIVIGALAIFSSTSVIPPDVVKRYSERGIAPCQFNYLKRHLFAVLVGIIAMFAASIVKLDHLRKMAVPLLVLSFCCLLLVFTELGVRGGGATRWLQIFSFTFQPSEIAMLSMVTFLAWYMSIPSYKRDKFVSFAIPIGVMVAFQVIFLKQPAFGTAMGLGIVTMAMLFLSGIRLRYFFLLAIIAIPIVAKLLLEPRKWARVASFLDPWEDPLGRGFQIIQSFIALGSGGLTGVGLGEGRQKLSFLPEVHTDFIFSLIGEEVGFIGAAFVVFLFFMLFIRGVAISKKTVEPFSYYLCFGISMMVALQAITNFAVATGMVPTTGQTLPFISYGGTSLVVSMTSIGLLLNISRNIGQENISSKFVSRNSGVTINESLGSQKIADNMRRTPQYPQWYKGYGYKMYNIDRRESSHSK